MHLLTEALCQISTGLPQSASLEGSGPALPHRPSVDLRPCGVLSLSLSLIFSLSLSLARSLFLYMCVCVFAQERGWVALLSAPGVNGPHNGGMRQ